MSTFVEKVKEHHLPEHWTPMNPGKEVQLVDVPENTEEYKEVCDKFKYTKVPKVKKLQRIQNPYLWGCYLLKKQEYKHVNLEDNEVTLYHETSPRAVETIIRDNFDWRFYLRTMFGKGVSFSSSAEYAHNKSTFKGAMFVTRMLRGQCSRITRYDCDLPPEGYDTTTSGIPNYCVVVGFNDNDFYPEYVVYWEHEEKPDEQDSSNSSASITLPE